MKVSAKFREYENGAMKGFVDFTVGGSIGIKEAKLVEGKDGLFIGLPQVRVGEEYRDIIGGVSKEFAEQMLEATLAARANEDHKASVGEGSAYLNSRSTGIENGGNVKALASLTIREEKDSAKSAFSIQNIRVMEKDGRLFPAMPSKATGNEQFPYENLCYVTKSNADFVSALIIGDAMKTLGIEKKEKAPSLDEKMAEAKEAPQKAPKGKSKAKSKSKDKDDPEKEAAR